MNLIVLCGRKQSGKDTTADFICEYFKNKQQLYRFALATALKELISDITEIDLITLDHMKLSNDKIGNVTTRQFMINISNKILKLCGSTFWLEITSQQFINDNSINLVTDMRYSREFNYFTTHYKPIIIKIIRSQNNDLNIVDEDDIDKIQTNYIIYNDSTLENLKVNIYSILDKIDFI